MDQSTTDQDTNVETGTPSPNNDATNFEVEARKMGWRPKEEFRGDEAKWVDAETFYTRGQEVLPIVRAENKALRTEIDRIKRETAQTLQIMQRSREREVASLTEQLEAAKKARKDAVESRDGDTFEAAETEVARLQREIADASKTPTVPVADVEFDTWVAENSWYTTDPHMRAMADGLATSKFRHLAGKGRQLYDAVKAEVEAFKAATTPPRDLNRPGPMKGGKGSDRTDATSGSGAGKRSYDNLLPEYKSTCDRQFKDFGYKDAKKWRDTYVSGCTDDAFRS